MRIVYTRPDGGVSVVVPSPDADFDFVLAKDVPADAADVLVCEDTDVPSDRTFRNAWIRGGKSVVVNMDKARAIHMDRIRVVRNAELQRLDVEYQRADEREDIVAKRAIAAQKQALRDLPRTFDLSGAGTPRELSALWPPDLPERAITT